MFQLAVVVAVLSFCTSQSTQKGDIFSEFWSWRMKNAPEFATFVGNFDYDDRLDEVGLKTKKLLSNVYVEVLANFFTSSGDISFSKKY